MIKFTKLLALALLLAPLSALAHVRWFAQEATTARPYQLTDGPVLMWIVASILLLLSGLWLNRTLRVPQAVIEHAKRWMPYAFSIASIGFGLSLIIFSLNEFVFAPNLPAIGSALLWLQLAAGIMIFLGIYERLGGLMLFLVFLLGFQKFGFHEMLDTLEMVGFALFIFIVGRPKLRIVESKSVSRFMSRFAAYGLPLLRIGTGLNLMVLGFSEKILAPGLTQEFLANYQWNFLSKFGMSDYWFAFAAGIVEFLFGLFLVLGLVTRITTLALAVFLTTTLALLGPTELIGHLPHFSIAIVLLIMGSGEHFKLSSSRT